MAKAEDPGREATRVNAAAPIRDIRGGLLNRGWVGSGFWGWKDWVGEDWAWLGLGGLGGRGVTERVDGHWTVSGLDNWGDWADLSRLEVRFWGSGDRAGRCWVDSGFWDWGHRVDKGWATSGFEGLGGQGVTEPIDWSLAVSELGESMG